MNQLISSLAIFIKRHFAWAVNKKIRTISYGLAKGFKRRGGIGFLGLLEKETKEELFIRSLDLKDKVTYDIGANLGNFSLYFSKAVGTGGQVIAFEPLDFNVLQIHENLQLNNITNVRVIKKGVGKSKSTSTICYDPQNTATASFQQDIKKHILQSRYSKSELMEIDSLDSIFHEYSLPLPGFIKIDVEGYELEVLEGMSGILSHTLPNMIIEIHGISEDAKRANIRNIYSFLSKFPYSIFHIESNTFISSENVEMAITGHIFCTSVDK